MDASASLSRRKQGFESPRERQRNQVLVSNWPAAPLIFSNFSPNQGDARDRLAARFVPPISYEE